MPISFAPLRRYMKDNGVTYYFLANQGIDAQTLQRIRHDRAISTETLGKICLILKCQPGQLIEFAERDGEKK